MHTYATFIVAHKEFAQADSATVEAALAETELEVDETTAGDQATALHGWRTAQRLALSPWGAQAKLSAEDGTTIYDRRLEALARRIGGSYRMVLT